MTTVTTPRESFRLRSCSPSRFLFVEATVGVLSGSLALLSDAGHMLTDAGARTVALVAQRLADRPRTGDTFGFRRAKIVAALINGAVLGVSAVWVIMEAVRRLANPRLLDVVTLGPVVVTRYVRAADAVWPASC